MRWRRKKKCKGGCDFNLVCKNGKCVPAANRCSPAFVCSGFGGDAPVCGSMAGGGDCGCYQSTEGNSVCLNNLEESCENFQMCDTSQDCRDTVGFHFYCRKPLANENNQFCGCDEGRCWPECDNPD